MKKLLLIFALCIFIITDSEGRNYDKDARKMIFYVDGVITTDLKKIENGQNNDSLKVVKMFSRNRSALLNCGEKFRNGVVFLESTKNKVK